MRAYVAECIRGETLALCNRSKSGRLGLNLNYRERVSVAVRWSRIAAEIVSFVKIMCILMQIIRIVAGICDQFSKPCSEGCGAGVFGEHGGASSAPEIPCECSNSSISPRRSAVIAAATLQESGARSLRQCNRIGEDPLETLPSFGMHWRTSVGTSWTMIVHLIDFECGCHGEMADRANSGMPICFALEGE